MRRRPPDPFRQHLRAMFSDVIMITWIICDERKDSILSCKDIDQQAFEMLTLYCNTSDNQEDNLRRAEVLGFTGRNVRIAPGAIVRIRDKNAVGENVFIGLYAYVNGNVTIGDEVLIGPHCAIAAGHHKFDPATQAFTARTEQDYDNSVLIGRGSWLASGVTVTAGVRIGRANLICANAVVTKNTEDYAIMAGVPARQVGRIDPETGEYHWFSKED